MSEDFQRLDYWMWCARLLKTRAACARHVAEAGLRINRQLTEKPHAKLRPGDVLTYSPAHGDVRVLRVRALATRRGPAAEARLLYEEVGDAPAPLSHPGDARISGAPGSQGGPADTQQDLGQAQ